MLKSKIIFTSYPAATAAFVSIAVLAGCGAAHPNIPNNTSLPSTLVATGGPSLQGGTHISRFCHGFNRPSGVGVDATGGTVYVADTGNGVVKMISAKNCTAKIIGRFNSPRGLAVGQSGNVYVVDLGDKFVREILPNGNRKIGSGLNQPWGVAVTSNGTLFVADTGNDAIKWFAGKKTGELSGYWGYPRGVATDAAGNLYSATTCCGNGYTYKFAFSGGTFSYTIIGQGVDEPWGLAVDASSHVYESYNTGLLSSGYAIEEFDPNLNRWTEIAYGFEQAAGVAVDKIGKHLYVTDLGNGTDSGAVWLLNL